MTIYTCEINDVRKNDFSFAVALLDVPPLPYPAGPIADFVYQPLRAVAAASDAGGEWSFCNLNQQEKDCIGDALVEYRAEVDKWYWCNLFDHEREAHNG